MFVKCILFSPCLVLAHISGFKVYILGLCVVLYFFKLSGGCGLRREDRFGNEIGRTLTAVAKETIAKPFGFVKVKMECEGSSARNDEFRKKRLYFVRKVADQFTTFLKCEQYYMFQNFSESRDCKY